jgi:XTP/dITP diphosphohydrolase
MKKIVLASNNAGKLKEFTSLLAPLGVEIIPQAALNIPEADETGLSFIENAILKARHASAASGLPALADDSGLAIPALGGIPGIYSARYAGKTASTHENIEKLLNAASELPDEKRAAEFHCVLAFMSHATDPTPLICDGNWKGILLRAPRGAGGFGYDPIFFVPTEHQTAAELNALRKNEISHRALAVKALLTQLSGKL